MNIIKAVKLAFEGKKVRRKTFFPSSDGEPKYSNFLPVDILANDWEVLND